MNQTATTQPLYINHFGVMTTLEMLNNPNA